MKSERAKRTLVIESAERPVTPSGWHVGYERSGMSQPFAGGTSEDTLRAVLRHEMAQHPHPLMIRDRRY